MSTLLTACAAPDPWDTVDPLRADPAGLTLAADLPLGLGVAENGATLTLRATRSDTGDSLAGAYILAQVPAGNLIAFRVAEADLDALRGLQREIAAWESAAPDATTGTFSIGVSTCAIDGGPDPDSVVSIWASAAATAPLRPIAEDVPVSDWMAAQPADASCP
ncbi:MAG: hypothetical protein AAF700_15770 [Pseudomonadota bacterium]